MMWVHETFARWTCKLCGIHEDRACVELKGTCVPPEAPFNWAEINVRMEVPGWGFSVHTYAMCPPCWARANQYDVPGPQGPYR